MSSPDKNRAYAHATGYGCFFKVLGLFVVLFLLCCGGFGSWYFMQRGQYRQQFTEAVNRVRSTGEPLGGDELNAFYSVPDETQDRTALYVRALMPFADNSPYHKDANSFPVVGTNQQAIPPPGADWPEIGQIEQFLARHQQIADHLHEAGSESGSVRYPADFRDGIATLLPHAQQVRAGARFLDLEAQVRMHRGDHAGATQSLLCMLRMGESLRDEPIMVSQLVRLAVYSVFVERLKAYLAWGQATDEELAQLQAAVAEVDVPRGLTRALQGERAVAYHTVVTNDMADLSQLAGGQSNDSLDRVVGNQSLAELRPGDSAMVITSLTEMVEASKKHPFPRVMEEAAAADARLQQFFADDQQRLPWNRHMVAQLLLPAVNAMLNATRDRLALQRATLAALAAERFRLAQGKYPEQLADLVPELLGATPGDPCDGRPLRYRVLEKGFVVYSIGQDKQDDQGDVGLAGQKGRDVGITIER
jgi:hypothetical protein